MNKPVLSVIIDTYNYANFIAEAIESVLCQNFPKEQMEIIVIDDGSTDDTQKQMKKYEKHIKYIYQKNSGQAEAFNTGFKNCKGDIICLLDADDIWYQNKLIRIFQCFEKDPKIGLVRHLMDDINETGQKIRDVSTEQQEYRDSDLTWNIKNILDKTIGSSALSFRKIYLEKILPIPSELRLCPDAYLSSHILFHAKMLTLKEPLGARRLHNRNAGLYDTTLIRPENLRNYIYICRILNSLLSKYISKMRPDINSHVLLIPLKTAIITAEILLDRIEGRILSSITKTFSLLTGKLVSPPPVFKSLTMLLAVTSPSLYLFLRKLYAKSKIPVIFKRKK